MISRIFVVALFALLTVTTPAHAAYVSYLNADVDLHFATGDELTGNINLTLNTPYAAAHEGTWLFDGNEVDPENETAG
jgi:hypothetical protein